MFFWEMIMNLLCKPYYSGYNIRPKLQGVGIGVAGVCSWHRLAAACCVAAGSGPGRGRWRAEQQAGEFLRGGGDGGVKRGLALLQGHAIVSIVMIPYRPIYALMAVFPSN
jgi:hypothetical protein